MEKATHEIVDESGCQIYSGTEAEMNLAFEIMKSSEVELRNMYGYYYAKKLMKKYNTNYLVNFKLKKI